MSFGTDIFSTMKTCLFLLILSSASIAAPVPLFDGVSFDGWEGNTKTVWRIREGVIVGGSLEGNPQNEFLSTRHSFKDFHLRLDYKIVGTEGFVNGGVQFRSKRIADPANEMSGYQADIGAGYSGSLYDESRRAKFLAQANKEVIARLEKTGEWNRYEVIAKGAQIELLLNGERTVIWVEREQGIAAEGLVALQIHGNCKAEISFRNLTIEELEVPMVPPQGEILSRFGNAQPSPTIGPFPDAKFTPQADDVIVFAGQENFVRMQALGDLEALLASGFKALDLRFRSMAWEADTVYEQWRELNFGGWTQQLSTVGATIVLAQFGQIEALDGTNRLGEFTATYHRLLDEFAGRTRKLVLISPMPFEKPLASHAPDLTQRNSDVEAYVNAVREIARQRGAVFVDLFGSLTTHPPEHRLTDNGMHLTPLGLTEVAKRLAATLGVNVELGADLSPVRAAIMQKNRLWFDCWRPANWSFVYGDRITSKYGNGAGEAPDLQRSFERQRPLVESADALIHRLARGEESFAARDAGAIPFRPGIPSLVAG